MKTTDVKALMRARWCSPEWAIFFEVSEGTGAGSSGYADAMAMNLWPSRGLELHGFEIKISRSDWLRERKNPEKAERFVRKCDRWYLITLPGVVLPGEVPSAWGHFEIKSSRFFEIVKAPQLQPEEWQRPFMAALLRRNAELCKDEIEAIVKPQIEAERELLNKRVEREVEQRTRRAKEITEKLDQIKSATGVDLENWTPPERIASAMRALLAGRLLEKYDGLSALRDQLQKTAAAVAEIEAIANAEAMPSIAANA